jgi:hypothetical protein
MVLSTDSTSLHPSTPDFVLKKFRVIICKLVPLIPVATLERGCQDGKRGYAHGPPKNLDAHSVNHALRALGPACFRPLHYVKVSRKAVERSNAIEQEQYELLVNIFVSQLLDYGDQDAK